MPAGLKALIESNKADMGNNPFAGRMRIGDIQVALLDQKYSPKFLDDFIAFAESAAQIARESMLKNDKGNMVLPKNIHDKQFVLQEYKTSLNQLVKEKFNGLEIDKPIEVVKKIPGHELTDLTAQHHPQDHKIYISHDKTSGMSAEQAVSWLVHETGHEIVLALRNADPVYLYGEENTELEYYANYTGMCSDKEYNFGVYNEAYDQDVEETTVRYMQAVFVHSVCDSKLRTEKICSSILTNTQSQTAQYMRDKNKEIENYSGGFGNWFKKQFVHA